MTCVWLVGCCAAAAPKRLFWHAWVALRDSLRSSSCQQRFECLQMASFKGSWRQPTIKLLLAGPTLVQL